MDLQAATPPAAKLRKDYQPPAFLVDTVDLRIDLAGDFTTVTSRLAGRRNPASVAPGAPLRLDGEDLQLLSVTLDGRVLAPAAYRTDADSLEVDGAGDSFVLETVLRIRPQDNTRLEGLYMSNGMYCTQCEPEGFRRITYFPDRPDVLAVFTTTITADRARYPVLLSNGNPVAAAELDGGRHSATWHDPFPKPAYLFAMVAGDLGMVEDHHRTTSGRDVTLRIYVEHGNEGRTGHAMASLKRAMAWDEKVYGLEYDLDLFMIVAVSSFNMGAMENKGLNLFNSKFVLADSETATDGDCERLEGIVAHEYFHNWTGNRVTCRDWFQLSLKEGLTVFRDQEFTADHHSRGVKRVDDVRMLRAAQFPEDAGPMAHPVRPDSYIEINNFYTLTIYEKGAEVVRMMHTLLGADGFRRGMDLYFTRHDGQAVTCDDFAAAMEDANGADLGQFRRWYEQAGTPELSASLEHDPAAATATLTVRQSVPPTPGQPDKQPMLIPLAVGLLGADGRDLSLTLEGDAANEPATTRVLRVTEPEQRFVFTGVAERPVPSLLRGFSAPVKLDGGWSRADLAFLMAHDGDPFARWDAGQRYAGQVLLDMVAAHGRGEAPALEADYVRATAASLADDRLEPAFRAEMLALPSEGELALAMDIADVDGIHAARTAARQAIGTALWDALLAAYHDLGKAFGETDLSTAAAGARRLRHACLAYLAATGRDEAVALAKRQADTARTMTGSMAALSALNDLDRPERTAALEAFHDRWQHDPLVLDKWFALRATSSLPGTLAEGKELMAHPGFDMGVPNRVRALIGSFSSGNPVRFHAADGSGYRFLADRLLEIDPRNPQLAARMTQPLTRWRRYDAGRQALMKAELRRIVEAPGLSKDSLEIASKSLA